MMPCCVDGECPFDSLDERLKDLEKKLKVLLYALEQSRLGLKIEWDKVKIDE